MRVLPDVPAIDRPFDYSVPDDLAPRVRVGSMVRVQLAGRRVAGWVVEEDVSPLEGVRLSPITKVVGHGPDGDMIDLCRWAAWRWSGRLATMLRVASPDRVVAQVPPVRARVATGGAANEIAESVLLLGAGAHVLQVSPTTDALGIAVAAARLGQVLVVAPAVAEVDRLARGLRHAGAAVARWPWDWQAAAGGATVVGGRAAVFAPAPALAAIIVVDEHDETLQNESSPTWHAREVAVERARRAGVPCVLVSPCPSLEALAVQDLEQLLLPGAAPSGRPDGFPSVPLTPARVDLSGIAPISPGRAEPVAQPRGCLPRSVERDGWAPLGVIDRRGEDTGRTGLFSSRLVDEVRSTARSGRQVICVLNRTGRARLLACRSCGTLAECEVCGAAVHLDDEQRLVCGACATVRPGICLECGSMALSLLRVGVTRAREELEALALEPVVALTGSDPPPSADATGSLTAATQDLPGPSGGRGSSREPEGPEGSGARIFIGTEAVLHRVHSAGLVAFLDFDQELLAPRYRAAEEALGLLVLASRRVGGRTAGGSVLVQTRRPEHEVVTAAVRADPGIVSAVEAPRRRMLGFPPAASIALVGGAAARAYVERVGSPEGIEVRESDDGQWLLRSRVPGRLQDHLATVERPPGRLRLQVDPARLRR